MSSTKRTRTGETVVVQQRAARRPIDKEIVNIRKTGVVGSQVSTTLITATFPCTITGLRWAFTAMTETGTTSASFQWAIVKVTQGDSANTMAGTDASTLYAPEQNCIVWGNAILAPFDKVGGPSEFIGTTKVMRKLLGGDQLIFIAIGEAVNTSEIWGSIQFFCRT